MGYLLVQPEVLKAKGIQYFNTIPDGRAIADFGLLKVLGTMSGIDIIGSAAELKKLIAEQTAAGITPPVTEVDTVVDNTVTDENGFEPSVEDISNTESDETVVTGPVEEEPERTVGENEHDNEETMTEDYEQQD